MLNVKREQLGTALVLKLSGDLDETTDYDKSMGATAPETILNTKEIARINSIGVKAWVKFFQARAAAGTKLKFVECSPAIVEQLNLIMNFQCGGVVESVYVPFICSGCKKGLMALFKVEDLKRAQFKLPTLKCGKCGGQAVFDDLPDEYFRFAQRG